MDHAVTTVPAWPLLQTVSNCCDPGSQKMRSDNGLQYLRIRSASRGNRMSSIIHLTVWCAAAVAVYGTHGQLSAEQYKITETLKVDNVPSWFPVGFCLLTHEPHQYVAYYNQRHQMVVAHRHTEESTWQKVELPSKVGWDSHNYISLAVDTSGRLHLSGNMHCVPLIYFRTRKPHDINTFEKLAMTGKQEQRCTYPRFLTDADGGLLFTYRSGGSGNGRRFYNRYDVLQQQWSRFFDSPLFEGEGERNAYPLGPVKGPDGRFHVVWVWRETPDCATNHHLSYCRSRDLKQWETASGKSLELPIKLRHSESWVDPIPVKGGIINGCQKLAFDAELRPMISYHKLDENGAMQIYIARFEGNQWRNRAVTNWEKNITFSGRGAMPFIGIRIGELVNVEPGVLAISYRHRDYGSGHVFVEESTLQPIDRTMKLIQEYPRHMHRPTLEFEGISVRLAQDVNRVSGAKTQYVLRWETLSANHDRPRQPPLPPASPLRLVKLERVGEK